MKEKKKYGIKAQNIHKFNHINEMLNLSKFSFENFLENF
jgi:hypothetical protein